MMRLITEVTEEIQYSSELNEATGEKKHYITGPYLVAESKNKNGRIYPLSVVESAAKSYITEMINTKRAYGELGHPAGPQINLDRVSHLITELKQDKNVFIGKSILTNTPMGNIARGLLEAGANLGVSCRGLGSLKSDNSGTMIVQNDYKIATAADIVADPSAPGAFVQGIMENVEWIYDPIRGSWHEEQLSNIKKAVNKLTSKQIQEKKLAIFENYIVSLTSLNETPTIASHIRKHDKEMAMHVSLGNYNRAAERYHALSDGKKADIADIISPFSDKTNSIGAGSLMKHITKFDPKLK